MEIVFGSKPPAVPESWRTKRSLWLDWTGDWGQVEKMRVNRNDHNGQQKIVPVDKQNPASGKETRSYHPGLASLLRFCARCFTSIFLFNPHKRYCVCII